MKVIEDRSIEVGTKLAATDAGDEIVISGIAARLPESDDIDQFTKNLKNNKYMVTNDDRRWKRTYENTPYSSGKISSNEKLDAGFFDVSYLQVEFMDPHCRQLMERSVEAVLDSGYSLTELQNTKTGVFIATTISDSKTVLLSDKLEKPHFGYEGCSNSMLGHQIMHHLKLNGPSVSVDAACGSSAYCLEVAYKAIRMGKCDNAIVGGAAAILNPTFNQFFYRLGVVSLDGDSMIFDGNGYIRSEGVAVLFLQRANSARRVYAELVHVKVNCDGFKEEGLTFPSQETITRLINETLVECKIDPTRIDVFEAHASGTQVGDSQELNSIFETFHKNRQTPLLLGSVKSSIGHTETIAGFSSMIKVILGMNNGVIYPNCNFHNRKEFIESLKKKNLDVVTDLIEWPRNGSGFACTNCYGFGGSNGFIVMKRWWKVKSSSGVPMDDLPRLVCFSGRNEQCLESILNSLSSKTLDEEYVRLWHAIFSYGIRNHQARGFVVLSKKGDVAKSTQSFYAKVPLCLVFSGVRNDWYEVLQTLSKVALFKNYVDRAQKILGGKVTGDVLGNAVLNAALIDTLHEIGVVAHYVYGSSFGVLSAGYADGSLSLEQLLIIARCFNDVKRLNSLNFKALQQALQIVIPKPKPLSEKWALENLGYRTMSAEYIVDHLSAPISKYQVGLNLSSVVFVTLGQLPELLINTGSSINVLPESNGHCVFEDFLTGLGRIYQTGQDLHLQKLYPPVALPVSRGTPTISPLIKWIHDEDYFFYRHHIKPSDSVQTYDFSLKGNDPDWDYLTGHVLDGNCITPLAAFIYMVWDTFSRMTGIMKAKMQVTFEDVRMHAVVNVLNRKKFIVRILKHSRKFEVEEMGDVVLSGIIKLGTSHSTHVPGIATEKLLLTEEDFYKCLQLRGYHYSGLFRGVKEFDANNQTALISWNDNWVAFLDNLLQLNLFKQSGNGLDLPVGIGKLEINAKAFLDKPSVKTVFMHGECIRAEGIDVLKISTKSLKRQKSLSKTVLEAFKFVPYISKLTQHEAIQVISQLVLENVALTSLTIVQVGDNVQCLTSKLCEAVKPSMLSKIDSLKSFDVLVASNGFVCLVLSVESSLYVDQNILEQTDVVSDYQCGDGRLLLLKKRFQYTSPTPINCDDEAWMSHADDSLKNGQNILLIVKEDPTISDLQFINCLKLQHGSNRIQSLFVPNTIGPVELSDQFVKRQLKKGLCVNVLKNGVWGTYRSLILKPTNFERVLKVEAFDGSIAYDTAPESDSPSTIQFSGTDKNGRLVMGLVNNTDYVLQWGVPSTWSLEEARSIPGPYTSAIYLLMIIADLKRGDKVLLNCLSPRLLEASANVAKYHNCCVFITDQNREATKAYFEQFKTVPNVYVGNSNSVSFKKQILKQGGAQIIINASTSSKNIWCNCFGPKGTFLQIMNGQETLIFDRPGWKFAVVETMPPVEQLPVRKKVHALFQKGIQHQMIAKLTLPVVKNKNDQLYCAPRFYCDSNQVYVVICNLETIGLEFIDWLFGRGAKKITLCSKSTPQNGYEHLKLKFWKNNGVLVNIFTSDLSDENNCLELLRFGPIGGIFILTSTLVTKQLDRISRSFYPNLQYFVVFSFMGEADIETLCRRRKVDGHPALVIQWRSMSADSLTNMPYFFETIEQFLVQAECVVSCTFTSTVSASRTAEDYRKAFTNILGISNWNTTSHHVKLSELGMNSISSVEVQTYLKANHGLSLDISEIRNLTLAKVENLIES